MISEKIKLISFFALILMIGIAINTVAVISPTPLDVIIGYIAGLIGFLMIRAIRGMKLRTISFITIPFSLTLVTAAILSEYCNILTDGNICARNPLILSSIPMFTIFFLWGFSHFYKRRQP